ncbi:MAG: hypothetical protein WCI61_03625 [Chloroflexota bacterium]
MRLDPHPDKGRALGRLEEKQGRSVAKGRRADGAAGGGGDEPPQIIPLGGG